MPAIFLRSDPQLLFVGEIGVGMARASILAVPYAILASALPEHKLGTCMGLFKISIVVPQLFVVTVVGSIMKRFFPTEPIGSMAFVTGMRVIAALAMLRVQKPA